MNDLSTRLLTYFTNLTFVETKIIQNESDTESETELISNNAGNARNNTSLPITLNNTAESSRLIIIATSIFKFFARYY